MTPFRVSAMKKLIRIKTPGPDCSNIGWCYPLDKSLSNVSTVLGQTDGDLSGPGCSNVG